MGLMLMNLDRTGGFILHLHDRICNRSNDQENKGIVLHFGLMVSEFWQKHYSLFLICLN